MSASHADEVSSGERFEFGKNWTSFLSKLSESRVQKAEQSLRTLFAAEDLRGKSFLDIGSGSGLFSLAARRLGAQVHSFDFDPEAVGCVRALKSRFYPSDPHWAIEVGSILDESFVRELPRTDIVYSWGVLHHTGDMWRAIEIAVTLVKPGGSICLALYNDQGVKSRMWWHIKKWYNRLPLALRPAYSFLVYTPFDLRLIIRHAFHGKPGEFFRYIREYSSERGMDWSSDRKDWIGGFPYENCHPEEVTAFMEDRGFKLRHLKRATSVGCHEFVFERMNTGGA